MQKIRLFPPGFRELVRQRRASCDPLFVSGVWRYLELLPTVPRDAIVSLGEGNMPLYESPASGEHAGVARLEYVHLGMNPTGSFADLGMTVAVSAAKASGAKAVACASAGDDALSMQAYAARAGMEARIAPPGSPGAGDAVYVDSDNPYRIEGEKCAAFALLEARSWRVPDWIVVSGNGLGMLRAIGKGLREAYALGLIERVPRCTLAPCANAIARGAEVVVILNSGVQYGVDAFNELLLPRRNRSAIGA